MVRVSIVLNYTVVGSEYRPLDSRTGTTMSTRFDFKFFRVF